LGALAVTLAGCQMPTASLQFLDGLDTAIGNVADGQQKVRDAAMSQLASQQESLDLAFESDLRGLASPPAGQLNVPATAPAGDPTLKLADVLTAKRLYDGKRTELQSSRSAVADTFDRLDNNTAASRQMVDMLRRLVLQQNALAGQTSLAVETILRGTKKN
ncbi:MAG: hypothetical protein PHU85_01480, partial [Phycisphaerae bacterium]|nr:hypothetical protein [Phycisphaerae bacterium]